MVSANPKTSVMAEVISPNAEAKSHARERTVANQPSGLTRSLGFKYYIHDSVSTLRFQLVGDLRSANVAELSGSWETARTTLGSRQFLLDLSQLYGTDDEGRTWLIKMQQSGAHFLPDNYLHLPADTSGARIQDRIAAVKLSLLGRVVGGIRGSRP